MFNVLLDGIVAVTALYLNTRCHLLSCEFLLLSSLLMVSRMVFIVLYFFIMIPLYEYYARFALSLAQSLFGLAIATVVIYITYIPYCQSDPDDFLDLRTMFWRLANGRMYVCVCFNKERRFVRPEDQKDLIGEKFTVMTKTVKRNGKTVAFICTQTRQEEIQDENLEEQIQGEESLYEVGEVWKDPGNKDPDVGIQVTWNRGNHINIGVYLGNELCYSGNLVINDNSKVTTILQKHANGIRASVSINDSLVYETNVKDLLNNILTSVFQSNKGVDFQSRKSWNQFPKSNRKIEFSSSGQTFMKWKHY
jgi:hypothetical protein